MRLRNWWFIEVQMSLLAGTSILCGMLLIGCPAPKPVAQARVQVYTSKSGMRFIRVPAQTFRMGGILDMWPVRSVHVESFWIAETVITNAQADMAIPKKRQKEALGDDQPMCGRGYKEILLLISSLSRLDGLKYELPTEAQWECAARGGLDQAEYPWGNESPYGRSQIQSLETCVVKKFPPNRYGLYGCSGNVSELVREPYKEVIPDPNANVIVNDPNPTRLAKGGDYSLIYIPVAMRSPILPEAEYCGDVGVRLMLADSPGLVAKAKWEEVRTESAKGR